MVCISLRGAVANSPVLHITGGHLRTSLNPLCTYTCNSCGCDYGLKEGPGQLEKKYLGLQPEGAPRMEHLCLGGSELHPGSRKLACGGELPAQGAEADTESLSLQLSLGGRTNPSGQRPEAGRGWPGPQGAGPVWRDGKTGTGTDGQDTDPTVIKRLLNVQLRPAHCGKKVRCC